MRTDRRWNKRPADEADRGAGSSPRVESARGRHETGEPVPARPNVDRAGLLWLLRRSELAALKVKDVTVERGRNRVKISMRKSQTDRPRTRHDGLDSEPY